MPISRLDGLSGVLNCVFIVLLSLAVFYQDPFISVNAETAMTPIEKQQDTARSDCRADLPLPDGIKDFVTFSETCLTDPDIGMTMLDGDVLVMFHRLNELRQRNGLSPFKWHAGAAKAAKLHAVDMLRRGYFDHLSPEGLSSRDRLQRLDRDEVFGLSGENLAYYSNSWPDAYANNLLQHQLENSPPHLENMLNPEYTHAGAAIVKHGYTYMAVQVFLTSEGQLFADWPTTLSPGDRLTLPPQLGDRSVGGWRLVDEDGEVLNKAYDRIVTVPDDVHGATELVVLGTESARGYLLLNGPAADL